MELSNKAVVVIKLLFLTLADNGIVTISCNFTIQLQPIEALFNIIEV